MEFVVRKENSDDVEAISEVVRASFATAEHTDKDEHNLVKRIRNSENFIPELSIVAEFGGCIIGHILLSKIKINGVDALALAPLAVVPEYQRQGAGKALINEALNEASKLGHKIVVVLGSPQYYKKFGFKNAYSFEIKAPFEGVEEFFMVLGLEKEALIDVSGIVEYPREFFGK